ncbi:hypothetical protein [Enterobacter kobei]|uniref:hypothetical protein n=1 Tax=Enterobacter kobei TaxID=208224 RepID=UPI00300DB484
MTMQKVRLKALHSNQFAILPSSKRVKRRRDKITKAINSHWTLKVLPAHKRELIIEMACLRAEIADITIKSIGTRNSNASVLISEKLNRIDKINSKLNWKNNGD